MREMMTMSPVEIDEIRKQKKSNEDIVEKFAESENTAVEVLGFVGKAYVKASNLTACAKRMGYTNVKAMTSNGRVYLIKGDV